MSELPETHIGRGTRLIMDAAESMGIRVRRMPKFIRPSECKPCGKCSFGCPRSAKWSAREFIVEAVEHGAELVTGTEVTGIIVEDGAVRGVTTSGAVSMMKGLFWQPGQLKHHGSLWGQV